jgi:predicted acyltransferase
MAQRLIGLPLIPAIASLPPGWFRDIVTPQLHHATWHGLTWVDFSFAGYVMIMGLAISLAFRRQADGTQRRNPYPRILRRTVLLFALGLIYNGGFSHEWPDIRLAGVLQRMAICYFVGAVIYLNSPKKFRYALLPTILIAYWLLMAFVPSPSGVAGDYSFEGNLAAWVDRRFLPGRAYFGSWDPEGILTTIPAIASCLAGMLWGDLLQSQLRTSDKLIWFFGGGLVAINLGVLWDIVFPINKSLWTSSYVLVTAGIGSLVLGLCYCLADVFSKGKWLFPFVVIGRNVLVAFLVMGLIPLAPLAQRFVGGDVARLLGQIAPFAEATVESVLVWLLLYLLYRHEIVVKV